MTICLCYINKTVLVCCHFSEATLSIKIVPFSFLIVLICLDLYMENIILLKLCVLYFHVLLYSVLFSPCLFQSCFTEVIFLSGKGEVT